MVFEVGQIDWQSNAGLLLDRFAAALPPLPRLDINVFGSAPLQLFVERAFLSEDIDLFTTEDFSSPLDEFIRSRGWGKGQTDLYLQVCDPLAFDRVNRALSDFDPTLRAKLAAVRLPGARPA